MKTKQPLYYRIGKGIVDATIKTGKYIKKEPLCFTYPLLGNLSGALQERIESLTKGKYNIEKATSSNLFTNILLYCVLGPAILGNTQDEVESYIPLGLLYCVGESTYRIKRFAGGLTKKEKGRPCGSVVGKIISLPLEAILGVYDGIKEKRNGEK